MKDMPWKPAKMVRFLKKNGFIELPKKGGHRRFFNPTTGRKTEVPMHSKELKKMTEKAILEQAGLEKPGG
ncbi:toxin-antitoxin system, toxin component, HicA family [Lactobacillus crispatus MV-3A-US]|nr:toxin-antitoxin system, toxin component, HicA family [Lactobacillus crispatus MV-3A-US]